MPRPHAVAFAVLLLTLPSMLRADALRPSAEMPLSAAVLRPAANSQSRPAIAAGNDTFLASWTDRRAGDGINGDVYASRIDREGRPLDPANLPLVPTWLEDTDAAVTWNGLNYVVVYATIYDHLGLTALEIDESGRILRGHPILRPRGGTSRPSIAWNGSGYLVAWQQSNQFGTASEVHGMMLDASLAVASEEFAIPFGGTPAVASDGEGFLVVSSDGTQSVAAPVTAGGVRGATVDLGPASGDVDLAWNGREYMATRVNAGIEVLRLARDGAIVAVDRISERQTISENRIATVWTGDRLVLAWADWATGTSGAPRHEVMMKSVDAESKTIEETAVVFGGGGFRLHLDLAYGGGAAAMVWDENDDYGSHEIETMTFDPRSLSRAGARKREAVSWSLTPQQVLDAAASGDLWGMLWMEGASDTRRMLRFGRVSSAGVILDGAGIDLGEYDGAAIAANDATFLIVAHRLGRLYAIRIARDGHLLGAEPVQLGEASSSVSLAPGPGGSFLVTWAETLPVPRPNYVRYDTFASVITADGRMLDRQRVSPPAPDDTSYAPMDVVWSGSEYHVLAARTIVSPCNQRICPVASALVVLRVTAEGTVTAGPVDVASASYYGASIASNGNGSAIVWDSWTNGAIRLKRLTRDGVLVDGGADAPGVAIAADATRARITFDGHRYVVGWAVGPYASPAGLTFATVDPVTGAVADEVHVAGALPMHVLAGGANGRTLSMYSSRYVPTPDSHPGAIERGALRILGVTGAPRMRAAGR